jgi:protein-disulfide isomerase
MNGFGPFQGPPKTMFFLGFFAGVALCTTIALIFFVWSIASGKGLAMAGGTVKDTGGYVAGAPTPTPQAPSAPAGGPVKPVDEKADHIIGAKNAKITLIEYSDFQCPYCSRHEATIQQVLRDYPNDVRLIYRQFPLSSIHPDAQKLAEASECAAEMGGNDAFWKYHDKIFAEMTAQTFTSARVVGAGKDIGLDETKFKACVDSGKMAAKVNTSVDEGAAAGVQGTPGTFVNGKLIEGAVPLAAFKAEIEAALK